jgi:broad specificity phosphatase PhoE
MRLGLVRHFRVARGFPKRFLVSTSEIAQWFQEYETSDIVPGHTDLMGIPWQRCYASDQPRAQKTARLIFPGEVIAVPELREMQVYAFEQGSLKLPFFAWSIIAKVKARVTKKLFSEPAPLMRRRISAFLDAMMEKGDDDVLIVSHGMLMQHFSRELRSRGFSGPLIRRTPDNGKLHLYERA